MSLKYQFVQGIWSKEPDMTKVLFDIQQVVEHMMYNMINQKYGWMTYNMINQKYDKDCFH